MTVIPSFTFAGGVLSESLWGRKDLNKYQTGLKKAENAVLSVEGGIKKRWGTYFTGYRKLTNSKARLVPWRIADDDSYVLEFGAGYIRFIRFGGYVSIPPGFIHHVNNIAVTVSGVMEVPSPFTEAEANEFKYTFANDIMYVAHKDRRPRQLRRLGLYDWTFDSQDFDPHPNWSGTVTADYFNDTTADDNYDPAPIPTRYKISATLADGTETKPSNAVSVNADLGHRRTRVELDWPAYSGASQYTIYKGANGIFGFIGYTSTPGFVDRNFAPSYEVVPIGSSLVFGVPGEGIKNPSVLEFYKQRMAYGASETKPQDLWFSRPLIFNSLTKSVPLQDDDAFQLPLVGRQRHTINHMLMLKKFIIFTDSAEWTMNTVENRAISAATADPVIETYYGADPVLRPMPIGNRILFVQNKSGDVLDMGYEYTADAFKADNLSRLVQDLFKNKDIVAWDYASYPENLLFCVLSDGTLAIMTYVREHEIWGWTTAQTRGKFTDVACVSEIDEDAVYFQVERVINGEVKHFIERYEVNRTDLIEDMIFSDCALTSAKVFSGIITGAAVDELTILFAGGGSFEVGNRVIVETSSRYWIGEVTEESIDDLPKVIKIKPDRETTEFPEDSENIEVSVSIFHSVITGANHLEGETIWALADGKVYKDIVVTDGAFSIPAPAAHIHFGLPFKTRIEVLDIDAEPVKSQFREKTVHEVTLNVKNTRGVKVGIEHPDYDLEDLLSRNSQTNMYLAPAPLNGAISTGTHISWGTSTEIIIESDNPLGMEILNIAPDIRYAG